MFTPKKKKTVLPEWTLRSHGSEAASVPSPASAERGKFPASPALSGRIPARFDAGVDQEAQDWRSFKQAGFLDEALIQKQDRDALVQKISYLENELERYQHSMGLLLIEKDKLTTDYEDLRQEFSEAQELLKREQTAHLMALSEVERREENLRKELENGRHCAVDDANTMAKYLENKEKELLALEEKLVARERVQNQKLYDEQNIKKHEFQLEMDQKRKVVDEELKNRVAEVEQKEVQVSQKTETVNQREQALEIKMAEYEERNREFELKWETLREREKCLKVEEKKQETVKENLQICKDELDKKRLDSDCKQQLLNNKIDVLKVTEEEKRELQRLQSELRQKKDEFMLQEEFFSKEQEALKQNKEKLEKEWKVLDEKKAEIETLLNQVNEEKEKFEKFKLSNEKRLKNENLIAQEFIQSQLEALRSKKASFEATMERERLIFSEEVETKRNEMLHELELQKRELEVDMQNKLENMKKNLLEKEKAMKEESLKELKDINHSKEEASKAIKEMSLEKLRVEKEMLEMTARKQFLKGQQTELRKEIDKLNILVKKLKDESKGFKEFLEKNEKCKNCGEHINGFAHFDLHFLQEMGNIEISPLLRLSADYTSGSIKDLEGSQHSEPNTFHPECDTNPRPEVNGTNSIDAIDGMEVIPNPVLEIVEGKHPIGVPDVSVGINEGKRGRNPRRGVQGAKPVKAVDKATEVILGATLEPTVGRHPSGVSDVAADIGGGKRGINRRRGVKGASSAVNEGLEVIRTTVEPTESKHPSVAADVSADTSGDNINLQCGAKGANPVKVVDEDTLNLEPNGGKHPCGIPNIPTDNNEDKGDINPRRGVKRAKSVEADEGAEVIIATALEPVEGKHQSRISDVSAVIDGNKRDVKPKRGVKRAKSVNVADEDTDMHDTIIEPVEGKRPSGINDVSAVIDGNKCDVKPKRGVRRAKSVNPTDKDTEVVLDTSLEPVEGHHPSRIPDVSADHIENKREINPTTVLLGTTLESVEGKHLSETVDVSADTLGSKRGINPRGAINRAKSAKAVDRDANTIPATSLEPNEGKRPSGETVDVSADTLGSKRGINPRGAVNRAKSVKAVDRDTNTIPAANLEPNEGKRPSGLPGGSTNTKQGNCDIKPRRGGKRANLGKTGSEDKEVILTQEIISGKNPRDSTDVSAGINENKPGIKPRHGGKRANSVKAVVEDTDAILNTTQEPTVGKDPSGVTDTSAGISRGSGEGLDNSQCIIGESAAPLPSDATGAAASEENHDNSKLQSVGVSPNRNRKRRQTITRGSKVSEENRYNLRRR